MNPIYMGLSIFGGVIDRLEFLTNFQLFSNNCMVFSANYYGIATIQMIFPTNSQVFPTIRPEADTTLLQKDTYTSMTRDETNKTFSTLKFPVFN